MFFGTRLLHDGWLFVLSRYRDNTNNFAVRPVKVQQRTSGGSWRTLQGLIDFTIVHSYLDTATKWGINKLQALQQLFTTDPWLPPALTQLNSYMLRQWREEGRIDPVSDRPWNNGRFRPGGNAVEVSWTG